MSAEPTVTITVTILRRDRDFLDENGGIDCNNDPMIDRLLEAITDACITPAFPQEPHQ